MYWAWYLYLCFVVVSRTAALASVADEISKLGSLLKDGLITPDEFSTAKANLLHRPEADTAPHDVEYCRELLAPAPSPVTKMLVTPVHQSRRTSAATSGSAMGMGTSTSAMSESARGSGSAFCALANRWNQVRGAGSSALASR